MKNVVSTSVPVVISQAQIAIPGVTGHAAALGLVVKSDVMTAHLADLVTVRDAHKLADVVLREKRTTLETTLDSAMTFARTARNVITTYTGTKASELLASAGFDGSLRVPRNVAGLLRVLQGVKTYLAAHADQENAVLNVTAVRAGNLINDLTTARTGVNDQKANLRAALNDRGTKLKVVRGDLQLLLKDLRVKLDPLDEAWERFGFKRPGLMEIPDVPLNLTALVAGPNAVALKWDLAARAENYRVWKRVVGVDAELVPVQLSAGFDFLLEGLPANSSIELAVSAVNNGGESEKSAVVTVTTP